MNNASNSHDGLPEEESQSHKITRYQEVVSIIRHQIGTAALLRLKAYNFSFNSHATLPALLFSIE